MNKVFIIDASESDCRLMSGLLTRAGYEPIAVGSMEAVKEEVAKLPPGAVVVTAMKFRGGTAQELINWQKQEGYKFPVIAVVDNLNAVDLLSVMRDGGAVDVVQRPAIDKQLVETVGRYARPENAVLVLDDSLIPRKSDTFRRIEETVKTIAATNANVIVFGESGTGKEQIARQIYLNSSRTESPCIVLDDGSAALVGNHNPKSEQSEICPTGFFTLGLRERLSSKERIISSRSSSPPMLPESISLHSSQGVPSEPSFFLRVTYSTQPRNPLPFVIFPNMAHPPPLRYFSIRSEYNNIETKSGPYKCMRSRPLIRVVFYFNSDLLECGLRSFKSTSL